MLLANKPTIVRQGTTATGLEDEKMKKFATAIVEFGKVGISTSMFILQFNLAPKEIRLFLEGLSCDSEILEITKLDAEGET